MKKIMYAAVGLLLMGTVSCKKSGEETKSADSQTETTASVDIDNTSDLSSNTQESNPMTDATAVDVLLDFLTEYGNKMKQVKNSTEFNQLIDQAESPNFTAEQAAYTLTPEDKARMEKAYDELYDILIPLALKYKVFDRNTAENIRKEMKMRIQNARNITNVC